MTPYHCLHVPVKTAGVIVRNPIGAGTGAFFIGALWFSYGMLPFMLGIGAVTAVSVGYMVAQFRLLRKPVDSRPFDEVPDNFMIHHGSPDRCVGGCGLPATAKVVVNVNGTRHALHACDQHSMYAQDWLADHTAIGRAS